jgi:hypothetical protein
MQDGSIDDAVGLCVVGVKEGLLFWKKEAKNFFELGHGRRNRHGHK